MSALHLLLEGPDLETLLDQVRTQYGPGARIVQAEKVRRGGLGGFFARELFTIQVEVPDVPADPPSRGPRRRGSPVQSVMDLVDRLNEEEKALHRGVTPGSSRPAPPRGTPERAVRSLVVPSGPAPAAGPQPRAVAEPVARSVAVSTQTASFDDVMSRLQSSIEATLPASGTPVPDEPATTPAAAEPQAPEPAAAKAVPNDGRTPDLRTPEPRTLDATVLPNGPRMAARAMRMGVPPHVLGGVKDPAEVYRRLLAWVESRPMGPLIVATPGQVIVVVGEVADALGVAGALARELGMDPAETYLAVPASSRGHQVPVGRLLSSVSDIATSRRLWQDVAGGTIVVVEAPMPAPPGSWLPSVVSALAPTYTWAVARACTKVDDVATWAASIGTVDALALVNLPATADPAASLAGPLPVGLLDGERATLTRWMAMLTDEGAGL